MADLRWSTANIAEIAQGDLIGDGNIRISKIAIDSRKDVRGALYVALKGERFDGHDFLKDVAHSGAAAALVKRPCDGLNIAQIRVADTLTALQKLAKAKRREFKGKVVALTGSSGKTTTRKLIASILSQGKSVHQSEGNLNNHIGVPLTLLGLEPAHDMAVVEFGCSDFGEIKVLTDIADPDVALITNVGPAHLEKLKDLDGVARAKGELFIGMQKSSMAVVNLDDPNISSMKINAQKRITFGTGEGVDVRLLGRSSRKGLGQDIALEIKGKRLNAALPLLGSHNAANALAAVTVATALDVEVDLIVAGLAAVKSEPGRLCLCTGPKGCTVIDDTYNANPASMRAAISVLKEMAEGRTIAVLGDMLELGERSDDEHRGLGKYIASQCIDSLFVLGKKAELIKQSSLEGGMAKENAKSILSHSEAAEFLRKAVTKEDTVLIKGSHGMRMDLVVSELLMEND